MHFLSYFIFSLLIKMLDCEQLEKVHLNNAISSFIFYNDNDNVYRIGGGYWYSGYCCIAAVFMAE